MIRNLMAAAVILASGAVFAQDAQLQSVGGQVMANSGDGFQIAVDGTVVGPGNLVSVGQGSSAVLVFGDGCRYEIEGGTIVTVPEGSPCAGFPVATQRIAAPASGVASSGGILSDIPPLAWIPITASIAALIVEMDRSDRRTPQAPPVSP